MSTKKLGQKVNWLTVYVIAVVLFLALPILIVIPSAFGAGQTLDFPPRGFSLRWFKNILEQQDFIPGLVLSLKIAFLSTIISLVTGGLAAYALVRYRFPGREALTLLFLTPLAFPAIVLAVAIAILLAKTGLLGGFYGLLFAHVMVTLPYAIRTLGATVVDISQDFEEAAATLGASPLATARFVVIPLMKPGLFAATTFCLITSFDEFTISLFLTRPGFVTLPIALYSYTDYNLDPTVAAVSTLLLVFSAVVIAVGEKLFGFGEHLGK